MLWRQGEELVMAPVEGPSVEDEIRIEDDEEVEPRGMAKEPK